MDVGSLFWMFFILMALQPVLKQRLLEASRQRMIRRIEARRNSRVILLVHRQETMGFLGFPFFRYIDIDDSEAVIRAIHMTDPAVPLDLVLHTPGGLVLASVQIARALKKHPGEVTVLVPHYAMSGGTLIALAADRIVMCEHAVLGPVDPQIDKYPAASIVKVTEQKPAEKIDDQTLILADQSRKALRQVHRSVRELLAGKMPDEQAEKLASLLSEGTWTHDHPITFEDARSMGLPVSNEMPDDIMQLLTLYPQPVRRQPSVEYIPMPRRAGDQRSE